MTTNDNHKDLSTSSAGCGCGHMPAAENLTNMQADDGAEGFVEIGLSASDSGGCCGGTSKAEDLSMSASGGCCGGTPKAEVREQRL